MHIDWKRKLSSRKFWISLASFIGMIVLYYTKDADDGQRIACIIMAGASLIAYILGESIADSGHVSLTNKQKLNSAQLMDIIEEENEEDQTTTISYSNGVPSSASSRQSYQQQSYQQPAQQRSYQQSYQQPAQQQSQRQQSQRQATASQAAYRSQQTAGAVAGQSASRTSSNR